MPCLGCCKGILSSSPRIYRESRLSSAALPLQDVNYLLSIEEYLSYLTGLALSSERRRSIISSDILFSPPHLRSTIKSTRLSLKKDLGAKPKPRIALGGKQWVDSDVPTLRSHMRLPLRLVSKRLPALRDRCATLEWTLCRSTDFPSPQSPSTLLITYTDYSRSR